MPDSPRNSPFFSICVPHHNRTSFMIEACGSLINQKFKDFEICVSDDCSDDGREEELVAFLRRSGIPFKYYRQERNSRYDANLRGCLDLAGGRYSFLLGNDDLLSSPDVLGLLRDDIERFGWPGIILTNYKKISDGMEFRRIEKTGVIGAGPGVAASNFRKFSFVSGVILETPKSKKCATGQWDGSEMYQTFIACRMISEGSVLLGIDSFSVLQGIEIDGRQAESFASKARMKRCRVEERRIPLNQYGRVVIDGIGPLADRSKKRRLNGIVMSQILLFTYPYWVFQYRRVQSWRYALGICLGMRPENIIKGIDLNFRQKLKIRIIYGVVSLMALSMPIRAFEYLYPALYRFTKRHFG